MYHVILAGGSGSRFWPKSRKDTPKQLLKITGKETMIRLTYDRLRKLSAPEKILVVASRELSALIHKDIHFQKPNGTIPKPQNYEKFSI